MFECCFTFIQANPVHQGHLALFEAALECSEHLDVFVGVRRQRPRDLPYGIRQKAVQEAIAQQPWRDKTSLLSGYESIFDISPARYQLLAMGSDVANLLHPNSAKIGEKERQHFLSFPSVLVLQRPNHELLPTTHAYFVERMSTVIVSPPRVEFSATDIRRAYRNGEDIKPFLPTGVWDIISGAVTCFENEQ